jgi:hypothetical protein
MTQYQGNVQSYVLEIQSPNNPYTYNNVISLHGARGGARFHFTFGLSYIHGGRG